MRTVGATFVTPIFFRLLAKLVERGAKPWSRLSSARVKELLRPMTVDDAALETNRLAKDLGTPALGIAVARAIAPGDFELLEFLAVSGPTWLGSMERVVRYAALLNPSLTIELRTSRQHVDIVERVVARADAMGRHINEFSLVTYVAVLRSALGDDVPLIEAALAHDDARSRDELRALLRSEVKFGAGENRLRLSRANAERPLSQSNSALFQYLDATAAKASLAVKAPSLASVTEQLVQRGFLEGRGHIDDVARALKMSRRTLQRRLGAEGTTWESLVDALRRRLAASALSQGVSASESSWLLGYSDPRAFRRALRRWKL